MADVIVKERSDLGGTTLNLLKHPWTPDPQTLPEIVTPKGLSSEREWYLFDKIRPFCPVESQDITCPLPTNPRPTSRRGTPVSTPPPHEPPQPEVPPAKKGDVVCVGKKDTIELFALRKTDAIFLPIYFLLLLPFYHMNCYDVHILLLIQLIQCTVLLIKCHMYTKINSYNNLHEYI